MEEILFDDKLVINVPDKFRCMSDEEVKTHFIGYEINRGYVCEKYNAYISVSNHEIIPLTEELVAGRLLQLKKAYEKAMPGYKPLECVTKIMEKSQLGILTFNSVLNDENYYNLVAVTNFDGHELMVTYTCAVKYSYKLSRSIIQMLEGMQF